MTPTRADLERLIKTWLKEAAHIDSFHATMGTGYHACADALAALLTSEGPAPTTLTDDLIDQMLAEVHAATLDAQSAARGMGLPIRERAALVSDARRLTVRSFLSQAGPSSEVAMTETRLTPQATFEARIEKRLNDFSQTFHDTRDAVLAIAREADTALRTEREARETAERERDEARRAPLEARQRVHDSFKRRDANGKCICPYCTRNCEELAEHAANLELEAYDEQRRRKEVEAERDALAQQVEALRQERDDKFMIAGQEWRRAQKAESALRTAQQDAARLREALEWLVNLGYGVGKGGTPETGELEAALEHGRAALTAPADPTGGQ